MILIFLGILSLISVVSITIQTGWKFTTKLVPKLPKNKRWSDIFISSSQLSVVVFIFYTINIWFWTDSSENSSDIWKMSEPVKLLESQASIASQYFSNTKNILTFDEAVDALPEEAEEVTNLVRAIKQFNGPQLLANFHDSMVSGQCEATLQKLEAEMYNQLVMTKDYQSSIEKSPIWPILREVLKNGSTSTYRVPFMNKREHIKQHLEVVKESLLDMANKFKKNEQELRNRMVKTTNEKNREFVIWYVLPSTIVLIFTILSIYTTTFNPKLRSSQVPRVLLNVFFYIIAIHVVVVFIYETVSNFNKCQLDPQLIDFYDFEIPSFNKSSRIMTKEDFLNCTATKSHIFAAPNDAIFVPTTIYDEYMNAITDKLIPAIAWTSTSVLMRAFKHINVYRKDYGDLVPQVVKLKVNCNPLREAKTTIEELVNSFEHLTQYLEPLRFEPSVPYTVRVIEKSRFFINKDFPNFQNAVIASIRKHDDVINSTGFDCASMSEAFQHGVTRTCFVINDRLIITAKLVIIGFSVISIITHILTNKKYENVLENSKNQEKDNQSNV